MKVLKAPAGRSVYVISLSEGGKTIIKNIIRLIYPPKCIFCGCLVEIKSEVDICAECMGKIPFSAEGMTESLLNFGNKGYCDGVVYVCEYSGIIKEALIKYKFFEKSSYFRAFAKLLTAKLNKMVITEAFDLIISIPLHKSKEKSRGYNQSELISKVISKEINIPVKSALLSRVKNTQAQSLLTGKVRLSNVVGAFKVNDLSALKGKNILLIDDILTTGNTINECCKVLKGSGANRVFAAVIASGRKY